jgi:arylsulfatase A-like enzyme/Flp pilus assembly protein TadD
MKIVRFLALCLLSATALNAASTPVILISVDTLRADHIGHQTPHIDSLASNGTVFSEANTPYPLTLPAHTALLTSTLPFSNGVQDNGIPLSSGAVTLATVLKKAGYRTGAFVGSFVLDRRFGLAQGFDTYDGPIDVHNDISGQPQEHKRPGKQVEEAAKQWLDSNASGPFFLFLHLYDLHAPYSLPADPALRHGETGYQAELAYIDQILGDFFAFLNKKGLDQKALVIFTSDHGEGLGDHGESSHGYFIYQSTLHVPLIIHWPAGGKRLAKDKVAEPVSLLDVAPTVLDAAGIGLPAEMRGRSLIGTSPADVYSESIYARKHFGCSSLRSIRVGTFKYIDAPKPELYDLATDPNERHNLYDQQKAKASSLRERLTAARNGAPSFAGKQASPTPETAAALRSLGYLSGSSGSSRLEPKVDPKDRIKDFERYLQALGAQPAVGDAVFEKLSETFPDVADLKMSLGMNLVKLGQDTQAIHVFKQLLTLDSSNAAAHYELGFCSFRSKQRDEAVSEFEAALALEPWYTRADEALAEIYLQSKDLPQAREHLNHLLAVDPNSFTAHFNLGILSAMDKDWDSAQKHLVAAVAIDPASAEAHNMLGSLYLQRGELEPAREQFQNAIRLRADYGEAHYRLGLTYKQQGKTQDAVREMRLAQSSKN